MVDFIQTRVDLDGGGIGAVGVTLRGYLAPRCAALEPRVGAAAGCDGLCELGGCNLADNLHTPRFLQFWNAPDVDTLRPLLEPATLDGVVQRLNRPLLVVQGARDDITQSKRADIPMNWLMDQRVGCFSRGQPCLQQHPAPLPSARR